MLSSSSMALMAPRAGGFGHGQPRRVAGRGLHSASTSCCGVVGELLRVGGAGGRARGDLLFVFFFFDGKVKGRKRERASFFFPLRPLQNFAPSPPPPKKKEERYPFSRRYPAHLLAFSSSRFHLTVFRGPFHFPSGWIFCGLLREKRAKHE